MGIINNFFNPSKATMESATVMLRIWITPQTLSLLRHHVELTREQREREQENKNADHVPSRATSCLSTAWNYTINLEGTFELIRNCIIIDGIWPLFFKSYFMFEHFFQLRHIFSFPRWFFKHFLLMDLNGIDNLLMEKNAPGERSKKSLIQRNRYLSNNCKNANFIQSCRVM